MSRALFKHAEAGLMRALKALAARELLEKIKLWKLFTKPGSKGCAVHASGFHIRCQR